MKYITSCPQCDTHFLLNDELIEAYQGKVQCGNCEHVFNAKSRLTAVGDEVTSADDYQASIQNTDSSVEADTPTETAKEPVNTNEDIDYFIPAPATEAAEKETVIPNQDTPETTQSSNAGIDDFLDNKNQRKQSDKSSSFLGKLFVFLLALALILQSIYYFRDEIARYVPQAKPFLERACVPLKCTIELSKNLDLITIGDSDMQEDDTYQTVINFSSSLQNNASYPQAYPSIQLTLTDSDDAPVIKKLITPEEYLSSDKKIKSGLGPYETATVKLSLSVDDSSVASYRILLLY